MQKKSRISILGCGWLGLELAKTFIKNGFEVKGSATSQEKLPVLRGEGIDSYLVHFAEDEIPHLQDFLDSDILIIAIPPGRKNPDGNSNYRMMADILTRKLPKSKINRVILISSTSVYGDPNKIVTEADEPKPDTDSAKLLIEVEKQFMLLKDKEIIVVRPGGLIGDDRYPGRFFSGKNEIENGLAPVNLIHKTDITGIVYTLALAENASGIYNAVAPHHPTKNEFYSLAAFQVGLAPPNFLEEKTDWKIVNSHRIPHELTYEFIYPNLNQWLKTSEFML
ncbi:MAG: SDR family NAD(P)-dependent oxidoreductase [Pyrinomonadaceae bacterium]|nr:SDR family NAD(P)-dependent oxidoreductase [Sphingobacteriaceae bacterium]